MPPTDKIEALRQEYLAAYAAANPDNELPNLFYQNGWWWFGESRVSGGCRSSKLREMITVLKNRVSESV